MKEAPDVRGLIAILTLALTGCVVGPNYRRPAVVTPSVIRGAEGAPQNSSLADLPWWEVFSDPTLKGLVQKALAGNYNLRIAIRRIEQARELAAQARSEYLPLAGYRSAVSGGKNEFAGSAVQNGGLIRGALATVASVSWEPDIWGRIRRSNEAALANLLATEQARRAIQLTVAGDTAEAYFELLGLDRQLAIALRTTDSFDETLKLFERQLEGGTASRLETSRASAARAQAASTVPELERQIALRENQIRLLTGQDPGPIPNRSKLLDQILPPEIPVGLPSDLLERRPDILAAEQRVRAANAQVGIVQAAYFPRFGLTALLGALSTPLSDLIQTRSGSFSFAANLAGPLYQGGALKAQKRQAIAFWEETRLEYELTVLGAFQDVSSALITRQKLELIRNQQEKVVDAYRDSVDVALKRYGAGRSSYFEVLEAQQQLFPAENALAVTETNRRTVIVRLYKALGGGWNRDNQEWANPR
jgi:outer membrane protein, multidrug efflux system